MKYHKLYKYRYHKLRIKLGGVGLHADEYGTDIIVDLFDCFKPSAVSKLKYCEYDKKNPFINRE